MLNLVTDRDAHPFPRMALILHRQGKFIIRAKLDLANGFHQRPLKTEQFHFTCTTTIKGVFQWIILVMGLKNPG